MKDIMKKYLRQIKAIDEGIVFCICSSCCSTYRVTRKNMGIPTMCAKCLSGVVIPKFWLDIESVPTRLKIKNNL